MLSMEFNQAITWKKKKKKKKIQIVLANKKRKTLKIPIIMIGKIYKASIKHKKITKSKI